MIGCLQGSIRHQIEHSSVMVNFSAQPGDRSSSDAQIIAFHLPGPREVEEGAFAVSC